ncbi:helix-turn-helix domain-containing protein [Fulvivirgaceae bacterium BMA10]|uniref:Helix-turn-helix domain-containing protein n=1 Tax=Splendidivirga corallicola TaxID=3051826 RepID=A0ABT8KTN5_9BACT|nr:helix-turn-helix domain-containing protein [Fulvivirgaceae bacterium BMA10]
MFKVDLITLFAAFGAFNGVLFAVLLWSKKANTLSNKIFATLLFVTSIRIAKNIVVHTKELNPELFSSYELWRFLVNFGISHQFAIGPLFLLYFRSRVQEKFSFRRSYLIHFIPYFVLVLISPIIIWPFWRDGGLWASYISILVYYLISFRTYYDAKQHHKQVNANNEAVFQWLKRLIWIAGLLMLAYSPALFKYIGYAGGAALYTLGLYVIGMIVFRKNRFESYFKKRYQGSSLKSDDSQRILDRLKQLMEIQMPYTDPQLSLVKLAQLLNVTPHHLSQIINEHLGKSFSDYINYHRIETAKEKLKDPRYKHLKIASIAYESGFNGISTFNTLFKKHTGSTPSEYRQG